MNRSQLLAISVVALMALAVLPVQQAQAAASYSEKLNVFVAGSSALWYFTFNGVNGSSQLTPLESTPGLAWYNVTAIRTTSWSSDFEVFGPRGYNLLPVPFVPSQGLFLKVGSDSFADASLAASALDSYFRTSFASFSNGTGAYTFYSPISFSDLVPLTLFQYFPTSEGGFAKAVTSSSLLTLATPFIVLEGARSTSGFAHSLVVGSISGTALSNSQPNLFSYFGGTVSQLTASSQSTSSVVEVRSLDGVISSSDPAKVKVDNAQFTGSYTLNLAAGKKLSKVNATVAETPAPLLATRAVDVGVLRTGANLSVTLSFTNLSPTTSISKISFTDNWWNATGVFRLLSGAASDAAPGSLAPGGSTTPVYRLQYTGNSTGPLVIPASVVRYRYAVGGAEFNATTSLNPIRLSLGADDAVVYAILKPTGSLGKPVGTSQGLNVTVFNVGTLPASSVVVAGKTVPGLAANSGRAEASVTQSASSVVGVNVTTSYSVTYTDPSGHPLNATTNTVADVFSHTSMSIASPKLTVASLIASLANQGTNVTLAFSASNVGSANLTSFEASGTLPAGLGCGAVKGTGLSCSGGVLKISYSVLNKSSTVTTYMKYNLTSPLDFIMKPIAFSGTAPFDKGNVVGMSNGVAIPAGVVVSKEFTPSQLFGGMSSIVVVTATNAGPLPVYNVTVGSTVDAFDSVPSGAVLTKDVSSMAAGGNATLSYGATVQQGTGTQTGTSATASFYFGGAPFRVQSPPPKVYVFQTLSASISTAPATPEEGKGFTITIVIRNPTTVQVSGVVFRLPVPSGLSLSNLTNAQVSSGVLTVSAGSIGPRGNFTATATAVASSGITVPFSGARLSFSYAGSTIAGTVPKSSGIAITEDVTTRYIIPTAFIIVALFAVAFYVRKKAAISPASQK